MRMLAHRLVYEVSWTSRIKYRPDIRCPSLNCQVLTFDLIFSVFGRLAMRFVDTAEWLVLRALHLRLAAAAESAVLSLHSNPAPSKLRYTLEFLDFELRVLATTVDTQQNLDGSVFRRFRNEVYTVFSALEKLMDFDIRFLLEDAGKAIEEGYDQTWTPSPSQLPSTPLDDQERCWSVVSILESFNKCMHACFRNHSYQSNQNTEQPHKIVRRFESLQEQDFHIMFDTLEKQLASCNNNLRHRMLLQLAGQVWWEQRSKPKSLYISSCKVETALLEVEFRDPK